MAEATQRYMLRATVRQAALYCLTRKRRVQSVARAHAGVECSHVGVIAGCLWKGQLASAVTLTSGCVQPTGDVYLSADLYSRTISSKISLSVLSFSSVLHVCVSIVAVPTGYKIVISCALRMHGIYCTQPSGYFAPLCFSAINAIHPSHP